MTSPAAAALLDGVVHRLATLQRCTENMRACVTAGDPNSILAASDELMRVVRSAVADGDAVQGLVASLGASSVQDAARVLRENGEIETSRSMLRLYASVVAIRGVQAKTAGFLRECIDTLDAAGVLDAGRRAQGRLLGSA